MNTLEIVTWSLGRLAITGEMEFPGRLMEALSTICLRVEYRRGSLFTFSFPERHRRQVIQAANNLE